MAALDLKALHQPFPANEIEWRVGSTSSDKTKGLALAYLTARHVMERLDAVCGPENWQDRYEFHGARTVCYLSIRIGDEWVTKADGAGDSDVEAEKGAISDALKRAAVKWGIGRYLYLLGNTWVGIEAAGRSFKIANHEYARLEKMLVDRFGTPAFSEPAPRAQSRELFDTIMGELRFAGQAGKPELRKFWTSESFVEAFETMPENFRAELVAEKEAFLASYPKPTGRVDPNSSLDRQFAETVG
jgi:hypothetical protein